MSNVIACISPYNIGYIVADANMAKEVTTTRKAQFPKPLNLIEPKFGHSVVSEEGEDWRRHRKIASAGFTERNNKLVVKEASKFASAMTEELKRKVQASGNGQTEIDVLPYTLKVALSVISSTSFGIDCDWETHETLKDGESMTFFQALETITANPGPSFIMPEWQLRNLPFNNLKKIQKAIDIYNEAVKGKIVDARNATNENHDKKYDLFSILIRTLKEEGEEVIKGELTLNGNFVFYILDIVSSFISQFCYIDDELAGNIFLFLLAGHETSAHTMAFALGLLALYQDVQDAFYQEIMTQCNEEEITYENASSQLKLGVAIMNETLRLFPIATALLRMTHEDTTLGEGNKTVHIPAGAHVLLNILGIHYNEEY